MYTLHRMHISICQFLCHFVSAYRHRIVTCLTAHATEKCNRKSQCNIMQRFAVVRGPSPGKIIMISESQWKLPIEAFACWCPVLFIVYLISSLQEALEALGSHSKCKKPSSLFRSFSSDNYPYTPMLLNGATYHLLCGHKTSTAR